MSATGSELRISDAERDAAVTALGEHYAAGRLTKDEYDERADVAWTARTATAVRPLFADLPAPHPFTPQRTGLATRSTPPARAASAPGRRGPRFPLLPVFLIVLAVVMVFDVAWPAFLVIGGLWWAAMSFRRERQRSGHPAGWGPRCGAR
ncbi:hypothetical protein BH18ACT9_BH18ACT9_06280 [soil metagenome]